MKRIASLLVLAAVLASSTAVAHDPAPTAAAPAVTKAEPIRYDLTDGRVTLHVVDLSPQFLAFYAAARQEPDAEKRFALWRQHYGFAAVPPGPRGEAMARQLLDAAWPKYESALPVFRAGARAMQPAPLDTARRVAAVLNADRPVEIRFVAYAGAFEDNAFAFAINGLPIVNVPLEMSPDTRAVTMAHEMTHAFHIALAGLSGGWERSIAATMLQEGLAMHVAREVVPGRSVESYVSHAPDWYEQASARRAAILGGIRPVLEASDGDTVFRFTIGDGSTGLRREAYYAGWAVVEHLRGQGMTLAQIARIPEADMPKVVDRALGEMLR